MKKKLLIGLLVVALFSLAIGCQASEENGPVESAQVADDSPEDEDVSEEDSAEEDYIAMIALGYNHQFWQAVKAGAEEAAEEYGVRITFEGPEDETMVDKQVDMLNTALANDPVAIAMAAIDPEAVASILQDAKAEGLKVVGFDSGLGEAEEDVRCSTDNLAAAELAAENVGRILEGKGKIGIIGFSQTIIDSVQRIEGFTGKIESDFPDIEVLDIQYAEGDHLKSAEAVKGMLQANPDIELIYANNEGSCVGAYNGLKEMGKIDSVQLVGFDSSAAMKEAMRAGEIIGAITQDPVGVGYKTIEAAVKLTRGEAVESFIDTGSYWYDIDNMDDDHIAPLLYD